MYNMGGYRRGGGLIMFMNNYGSIYPKDTITYKIKRVSFLKSIEWGLKSFQLINFKDMRGEGLFKLKVFGGFGL